MSVGRRLGAAMILLVALLAAGTIGYRVLVGGTWFDGLYMTVITVTTVGFGEVVPGLSESVVGRTFTIVLLLIGMGLLLWVVSTLTAFFVEGDLSDILRRRRMQKAIDAIRDHVIVCGVGATGIEVVDELVDIGVPAVVIEQSQEKLDRALVRMPFLHILGDATSEEVLMRAGIERARGLVTGLPVDKDNLVVTFMAHQMNPSLRIVSRGIDPAIRERLKLAGASSVVFPSQIGGLRLVSEMVRPHVVSFLDRMLRPGQEGTWRFEEVEIGEGSAASGRTLGSLKIAERSGMPVLAMSEENGHKITYYPDSGTVLHPGTRLVVMGRRDQVEKLRGVIQSG